MDRTIADALADPSLFATSAIAILIDRFGAECLNWEQETLEMEIRGLCPAPDRNLMNKVGAACTILTTDVVHRDALSFNNVVQVLNFDDISPSSFIPASLDDYLWGCTEMRLLEGPEEYDSSDFSPDIKAMVGKILIYNGITDPPPALEFADIPEDAVNNRDNNLGADSIMFESYWSDQREAVTEADRFISGRYADLLSQLMLLPLKHKYSGFTAAARDAMNSDVLRKSAAYIPPPAAATGETPGRKTKIKSAGNGEKVTVAARPIPAGTDIGKVVTKQDIITPSGQAFVTDDLKEFAKNIVNARPGNTQVTPGKNGEPRLYATSDIREEEPISTDLSRQSVIPANIKMLKDKIKAVKSYGG